MLIILSLIGIAAAVFLLRVFNDGTGGVDLGLVTISVGEKAYEMNMAAFLIMLFIAFLLLYVVIRLIGWMLRIPKNMRKNREIKKQRRVAEDMERGYMQYLSGKSGAAQRLLDKGVNSSMPVLASLTAAQAANQIGDSKKREAFIESAIEKAPQQKSQIELERARMLVQAEDWAAAVKCTEELRRELPKNPEVVRMLTKSLQAQGNDKALYELAPVMRRLKSAPADKVDTIEHDSALSLINSFEQKAELTMFWANMNKRLQKHSDVAGSYAKRLLDFDDADTAEEILRTSIKHKFDADNITLYGLCQGSNPTKMLSQAEKWMKRNKNEPSAYLTAGRLAIKNGLSAKAREYLERATQLGAGPEAAKELGILLEGEGDTKGALSQYRQGLDNVMSVSSLPSPDETSIDTTEDVAPEPEAEEQAQSGKENLI